MHENFYLMHYSIDSDVKNPDVRGALINLDQLQAFDGADHRYLAAVLQMILA